MNKIVDFRVRLLEWDAYVLKHEMGLNRLPTDDEVANYVAEKISDLLASLSRKNPEALAEHAEAAAERYLIERNAELKAKKTKAFYQRELLDGEVHDLRQQIADNIASDPELREKAGLPPFVHKIHVCPMHAAYPELRPSACGMNGCYSTVHFEGEQEPIRETENSVNLNVEAL